MTDSFLEPHLFSFLRFAIKLLLFTLIFLIHATVSYCTVIDITSHIMSCTEYLIDRILNNNLQYCSHAVLVWHSNLTKNWRVSIWFVDNSVGLTFYWTTLYINVYNYNYSNYSWLSVTNQRLPVIEGYWVIIIHVITGRTQMIEANFMTFSRLLFRIPLDIILWPYS